MKYYTLKQDLIQVNGTSYDLDHNYMAPYERNDLYLNLIDEQTPQSPDTALDIGIGQKLYADIDYEYNYFAPEYQRLTTELHRQDQLFLLPSLNAWFLLGNRMISEEIRDVMFTTYKRNGEIENPDRILSKDFFMFREQTLGYFESNDTLSDVISISGKELPGYSKTEFIDKRVAKLYADVENKREMFPMFSKLKITGVEKTEICNLLEQYELEVEFIDFLVSMRDSSRYTQPVEYTYAFGEEEGTVSSPLYVYAYEDFINYLETATDKVISVPSEEQTTCEYFESFLKTQVFKSKALEMIENLPASNAYPVAFRLEKYDYEGKLFTSHYFFNYTELETFMFFDTQVAYREQYTYDVRIINMIKVPTISTTNFSGEAMSVVFVEEPYYREDIFILDSPPISPDIELITYRGIDNKVLILFNQMIDKRAEVPVYINPSDTEYFKDQYLAQKIEEGKPIIFESDDPADFEFFRLKQKPVEYKDFSNENYKLIQSNDAYSSAYEDTIMPNQTYYYMFRTQDKNGFVSNPSPIYEFILIKEGETLYPKIRIVPLAKPEPPAQKEKSFKKYIKIGLSPRQYLLPQSLPADLSNSEGKHIDIGVSEDNILVSNGSADEKFRKFKFRIRSKNTGKLIDINVTFKKNKVIKA